MLIQEKQSNTINGPGKILLLMDDFAGTGYLSKTPRLLLPKRNIRKHFSHNINPNLYSKKMIHEDEIII